MGMIGVVISKFSTSLFTHPKSLLQLISALPPLPSLILRSHFMHPTHQPSHVVVDPVSLTLLRGSTLDFATELIGSSFRIVENPQAKGGCGCGVSWEAKF